MYNSERDKNQDDDAVFIFNGKNGQVQGITKFHECLNVILVDFFVTPDLSEFMKSKS
jgi:hypothetical protein